MTAKDYYDKADKSVIAKDFKNVVSIANQGCLKGSVNGCGAMELFYQRGFGVKKI